MDFEGLGLSDFVLAEALGLTREVEEEEPSQELEYSESDLKRVMRRKMVFERRVRGDTVEEICSFLQEKGYSASQRTVFYDLKSSEVQTLSDELIRAQFRDITWLRSYALQDIKHPNLKALVAAINARGMMINCLKPKVESNLSVEVNVQQQQSIRIEQTTNLLAEYEQVIRETVRAQEGNLQEDNSGEPLHKTEANSKTSTIPVT